MSTTGQDAEESRALDPEDETRADLYSLLARLFFAPPDATLLGMIVGAPEIGADAEDAAFSKAWAALVDAAGRTDAARLGPAYDALFDGGGGDDEAKVSPYFGAYLAPGAREKSLSRLQGGARTSGLARESGATVAEDHVSRLCEGMRRLVSAGSGTLSLTRQRDFFMRYLAPAFRPFCAATQAADTVGFYAALAAVALAFLVVEEEALGEV